MLQWSFVRDDQPLADTATQIALALRDEVVDLERAGIAVIQVDEPALREGLPLRRADRAAYLDVGDRGVPAGAAAASRRHPDPHPHVLRRVRRDPRRHRRRSTPT